MSAELERRQFGATLPVYWWDQPHLGPDVGQPFETLIEAAAAELVRLSLQRSAPVDLLASSFGAYLARALMDRVSERIRAVTISGGVWDLATAILRLGSRFADRSGEADLEAACREAAAADTPDAYLGLLARVSAMPGFIDCYWSPSADEARAAMHALAEKGRLINWPTCQAVMGAALTVLQVPLTAAHSGKVRILLGRFDPYFDESDVPAWKALWPSATVEIVDAGHFPHLELPPPAWMPA